MKWIYAMYKRHNIKDIKINNQMQIIENKMKFSIIDKCPICYDETNLVLYECFAHYYCLDCIYQGVYKDKKCAICRMTCIDAIINTSNITTRVEEENSITPSITPRVNRPRVNSDSDDSDSDDSDSDDSDSPVIVRRRTIEVSSDDDYSPVIVRRRIIEDSSDDDD